MTPLHWAVRYNEPETVRFLLDAGASLDLRSTWVRILGREGGGLADGRRQEDETPLDMARRNNHAELVEMLEVEPERRALRKGLLALAVCMERVRVSRSGRPWLPVEVVGLVIEAARALFLDRVAG